MAGEYCWAITQAVMLQPIVFHCVAVGISTGLPRLHVMQLGCVCVFNCEVFKIRLVADFPENYYCVSRVCVCVYVCVCLYVCVLFIYVDVKESRNRPDVAQRVPGGLGAQIFMTFGT